MNHLWILIISLIIIIYIGLLFRYYYSIQNSNITILQCDVTSFEPKILKEKMPIVCREVGYIDTLQNQFQKIKKLNSPQITNNLDIYSTIRIQPLFCKPNYPIWKLNENGSNLLIQSRFDYMMLIQMSGKQKLSIFPPNTLKFISHLAKKTLDGLYTVHCPKNTDPEFSKASYIEIILNEGDALILPFQWWYTIPIKQKTMSSNTGWYCILSWENIIMKYVHHLFI
jgi:hypothetical protein